MRVRQSLQDLEGVRVPTPRHCSLVAARAGLTSPHSWSHQLLQVPLQRDHRRVIIRSVRGCELRPEFLGRQRAARLVVPRLPPRRLAPAQPRSRERELCIGNLLVRIHFIFEMIRWTGLAPWEFEFPFPGSLTSTFLEFPPYKECPSYYSLSCPEGQLPQPPLPQDVLLAGLLAGALNPGCYLGWLGLR